MSDNAIEFVRSFEVREYTHTEMAEKEHRMALSEVIGYDHGYEPVVTSAKDIYMYKGKEIAQGKFLGFMDPDQEVVVIDNLVFKNGVKIADKSRFGTSFRGGRLFKPDNSKLFWADNAIIRMVNGVAVFYDDTGKEVKEIEADKFLGVDRKTKQSAFVVNGEVFVYDHKDNKDIKEATVEQARLQEFTIYEGSLTTKFYTENDIPRILGIDTVYDENGQPYKLSSLRRFLDDTPYEFHNMNFSMPEIRADFFEIGGVKFFENKTTVLLDENSKGIICAYTDEGSQFHSEDKGKIRHPSLRAYLPKMIEHMELFNKETLREAYQNLIRYCADECRSGSDKSMTEYIVPFQEKFAELFAENLSSEWLEKYNRDILFTRNLSYSTLSDAWKMESLEQELDIHPEMAQELSGQVVAKYLLLHPEKKDLSRYIKDTENLSDVVLKQLYDIGINPLSPDEFPRALSGEQKLKTCSKNFEIENADDFRKAFKNLAVALRDDNPINAEIAEMLLLKLVKNHKDVFLGEEKSKSISDMLPYWESSESTGCKTGDIKNAAAFLISKGVKLLELNDFNDVAPKYKKKLAEQGLFQVNVTDYLEQPVDELCPVNQLFVHPYDDKIKTNLLDYFLQYEKSDKVVALLNCGANVFANVERFSRKQNKVFPIKPFARFVDNQIFLKKPKNLRWMMEAIAQGLDASKENVIDKIFESLPYKTKENETVKQLQAEMHQIFERVHQKETENAQAIEISRVESLEKSHLFYMMHLDEWSRLDERRRLADGKSKENYKFKYADEYEAQDGYGKSVYYSHEYMEKQEREIESLERKAKIDKVVKNFNRFLQLTIGDSAKTIQERLNKIHLRLVIDASSFSQPPQICVIDKTERDSSGGEYIAPIKIDDDLLVNLDNLLIKKETAMGCLSHKRAQKAGGDKTSADLARLKDFFGR